MWHCAPPQGARITPFSGTPSTVPYAGTVTLKTFWPHLLVVPLITNASRPFINHPGVFGQLTLIPSGGGANVTLPMQWSTSQQGQALFINSTAVATYTAVITIGHTVQAQAQVRADRRFSCCLPAGTPGGVLRDLGEASCVGFVLGGAYADHVQHLHHRVRQHVHKQRQLLPPHRCGSHWYLWSDGRGRCREPLRSGEVQAGLVRPRGATLPLAGTGSSTVRKGEWFYLMANISDSQGLGMLTSQNVTVTMTGSVSGGPTALTLSPTLPGSVPWFANVTATAEETLTFSCALNGAAAGTVSVTVSGGAPVAVDTTTSVARATFTTGSSGVAAAAGSTEAVTSSLTRVQVVNVPSTLLVPVYDKNGTL